MRDIEASAKVSDADLNAVYKKLFGHKPVRSYTDRNQRIYLALGYIPTR